MLFNQFYKNLILHSSRGLGVFAGKDFEQGEIVEIAPCIYVTGYDESAFGDYVFASNVDEEGSLLALGYGSLYNHSDDPSIEYQQYGKRFMVYRTIRAVSRGEELTVYYGDDWWTERDGYDKSQVSIHLSELPETNLPLFLE